MKRQTVTKAIPWAALDSIGSAIISLISIVVLSRLLSPSEFGLIAYAQSVILLLQVVIGGGLHEALVQKRPIDMFDYDSAFVAASILGGAGAVACAIGGYVINFHAETHNLGLILAFEGTACVFAGFNLVPMAMLERKLRARAISQRVLLSRITYVVSAIGLAVAGAGIWSVVAAGILQNVVNTVVLWSTVARRPRLRVSWVYLKKLFAFGFPVMLEGLVWAAMNRVFFILVGIIHGVETLGLVSLATRGTELVGNILGVLVVRIGLPTFSALNSSPVRLQRAFLQATEGMSLLGSATFLGLFATAHDWVPILHGPQWAAAIPLVQVFCLCGVFTYATAFVGAFLRATDHPRVMLPITMVAGTFVLLAVPMTKGLDDVALGYAWAARLIILFPASIYLMKRFGGVPLAAHLRAIVVPILLSTVMLALVMAFRELVTVPQHLGNLIASGIVGGLGLVILIAIAYRTHVMAGYANISRRIRKTG